MGETRAATGVVLIAMIGSAIVLGWTEPSFARVGDVWAFADAGSTLLSTHWLHAFHAPAVQAGPLELVLAYLARAIGGSTTGFAIVLDTLSWSAVTVAVGSLLEWRSRDLALFGGAALGLALPAEGYTGHPAELAIAALWLLAARASREDRLLLAGALIGLSTCFEVWGALGVTVLALAPTLRRTGPALALAAAVPIACFLPFVAGGDFHMFQFDWAVLRGPATLIVGYGHPFTWQLRVAEGAVVVLAGVAVARGTRRVWESIWIVPAVTMLVRIALDPMVYGYYYDPALIALLLGGTTLVLHPKALAGRIAARMPRLELRAHGPTHFG